MIDTSNHEEVEEKNFVSGSSGIKFKSRTRNKVVGSTRQDFCLGSLTGQGCKHDHAKTFSKPHISPKQDKLDMLSNRSREVLKIFDTTRG